MSSAECGLAAGDHQPVQPMLWVCCVVPETLNAKVIIAGR